MPLPRILALPPLLRPPTTTSALRNHILPSHASRPFHITPRPLANLPPRRPLFESEFTETFLRGSGPGGQKINKTSCAVQLKHLPTGIVVKCQETRSRAQNRKLARRLLQDRIEEMELGESARTVVKRRRESERKRSRGKKARRKYRKLAEGEKGEDEEGVEEGGGSDGEALGEATRGDGASKVG
ncbi:hypothetical protein K458DRAFT_414614 [Lentithecium fluviatile CBS 122367]|uniref:Prokaryotic-type class I peptide chain release factors domain-containing protein n=1 Tax=Lentithecium fluviatile CBS 122367 TaxID=1168545 RepID=A0A6G1JEQ0_9PLEO|nr:hypothetical protein K458DRAFT_414614 [Lentithecium fluviatile CBS 122367]